MLDCFPSIEDKLTDLVTEFTENAVVNFSPILGQVNRERHFEGEGASIERSDGSSEIIEYRTLSSEQALDKNVLLYGSLQEILTPFVETAKDFAEQQTMHLFETVSAATKKTGNIIQGKGKSFDFDMFLECIERFPMDFDNLGQPIWKTLVIPETMGPVVHNVFSGRISLSDRKRLNLLITKKRREWLDREADRILVG